MKRRASDRGAGETSAKAQALGTGIAGNNAKRAGPFILGKPLTVGVWPGHGPSLTYTQQSEVPARAVVTP